MPLVIEIVIISIKKVIIFLSCFYCIYIFVCLFYSIEFVLILLGILAKNAVEAGLEVNPLVKTSLSPGSGVVTHYLEQSGVLPYLSKLGFDTVGFGCMTCIGNSGPLAEPVVEAIEKVRLTSLKSEQILIF